MLKLNKFVLFGILFMSSILLTNGMYSSQIFAIEAQNENNRDQSGNLNEAEINADIEQENKCKKDTECENENEINNQLNILNNTQSQGQSVPPTCETCFTQNLNQDEITEFLLAINEQDVTFSDIQDLCQQIDQRINANEPNFPEILAIAIFGAGEEAQIPIEKINALADCLEEVYGITIPRPT